MGRSPIAQPREVARFWSAASVGPQVRFTAANQASARMVVLLIRAMAMKAWAAMVAISRTRRSGYAGRGGPGSGPQMTHAKR